MFNPTFALVGLVFAPRGIPADEPWVIKLTDERRIIGYTQSSCVEFTQILAGRGAQNTETEVLKPEGNYLQRF